MENFTVTFGGFKTKEQAREFLSWYGESGEQTFDIWRECRIEDTKGMDGCPCYVNMARKGNKGKYFDDLPTGYYAELK